MDNSTARQHSENAVARILFALPTTDPMTNPPHRPIPTGDHIPRRPLTDDEWRRIDRAEDRAEEAAWERRNEGVVVWLRRRNVTGGAA